MKIIAVDDEKLALEALTEAIRKASPNAEVFSFRYPEDVLAFLEHNSCDVAFLDIEMTDFGGIGLAELLKSKLPGINIIFATGYANYREAAFDLHASGYLVKPITPEKVRKELADLRHPVAAQSKLRVCAFGHFEVFYAGTPLEFKYTKTKELLAYLIDRKGALCTIKELRAILFEDEEGHETYFKSIRRDLLDTLGRIDCSNVILHQHGKLGIVPEKIDCDYYDYRAGKTDLQDSYRGEYMSQYSWAEVTHASLELDLFNA